MKRFLMLTAIVIAVFAVAGISFAASQSANIPITANVGSVGCKAIDPGTLSLLISDPSATTTTATSTGTATTIQCQTSVIGALVTAASANAGGVPTGTSPLAGLLVNGADSLSYDLAFTTTLDGLGFGGSGRNVTLITANAATATPTGTEVAGVYSDTITITVTY